MQLPRPPSANGNYVRLRKSLYVLILLGLTMSLVLIDSVLPEARAETLSPLPEPLGVVFIDTAGYPLSANPVWNLCVRGSEIPVGVIRRNADTVTHRRGKVRVQIPKTCADYRIGKTNIWKHPDFLDVTVYLAHDGKLLGVVTEMYVSRRVTDYTTTLRAK
ncbi:MAG: hypothetical protein ABL890_00205 [Candidatus Peribacteraceae bacterium]